MEKGRQKNTQLLFPKDPPTLAYQQYVGITFYSDRL